MKNARSKLCCSGCNAPLEIPADPQAMAVRCAYCEAQTPLPPELLAERQARLAKEQAGKQQVRLFGCTLTFILLTAVLPILVISVIVGVGFCVSRSVVKEVTTSIASIPSSVTSAIPSSVTISSGGSATTISSGSSATFSCTGQRKTFEGRTFRAGAGLALLAGPGCELTLINCTVQAPTGISMNNARLIVRGGRFETTGPSIVAAGTSHIEIDGGATLQGEATITVNGPTTVVLGRAKISGRNVALMSAGGARIERGQAEITGRTLGL